MADTTEKKRRKPKLEERDEEEDANPIEADPPRGKRGKHSQDAQVAEGETEKKEKKEKKPKTRNRGDEAQTLDEEVVINLPETVDEQKERKTRKKTKNEAIEVSSDDDIAEEVDLEMGRKKKKKKAGASSSVGDKPKVRSLAQSRKWDQEDLEVIVPEEEVSEESEEGEGGKGQSGRNATVLEIEDVLMLDDEEKQHVDWLTKVMPDEILRKIYSHLDPPIIDGTAMVCHRMNELLQERAVWKVYQPEWTYVNKERFNKAHSRSAYAALYNLEMGQREATRRRIEAVAYAVHLTDQSEWAKGFMTILLFNRSIDYFSVLCFILGTCFAVARCQEIILWNWRLVLLPFYIPMFQLILTPLVYDLCRQHYTSANIDEVTESKLVAWHVSFVTYRPYRPLIYLNNLALSIFWVLLMIKLNDNLDGIPAGPLIIPWLLLLIAIVLEQMFGWASGISWKDGKWVDRIYIMIVSVITAVTLIMLVLRLDRVITWNWVLVLIPLWILFGFMFVYPWIALFCASCSYSIRDNIRIVNSEGLETGFALHVLCVLFLMVPIATWLVLIAVNLDGTSHRPWQVVFIPIFIIEGMLLIGCGILDFAFWCND